MAQQSQHIKDGASIVVIDHVCSSHQLLISLSKNGEAWLSPVGWTEQQKVTLLDCRSKGNVTEVDIPSEFAKYIKSGDVLVLRCSEHNYEQEIIWESSAVPTRSAIEPTPVIAGLASGLFSRLKNAKAEPSQALKSETELRAEDADRAAENFKAKMEAATAAKEEAQRKALAASREAEAALRMEADRIAQMECAAKALEEAERLKHEEHLRVEDERRATEVRLAEEARLREEARQREIAVQKEQNRKAALHLCKSELDKTKAEDARLKDLLETLKNEAHNITGDKISFQKDLEDRREFLPVKTETTQKRYEVYQESASKLDGINAVMAEMQTEADHLDINHQAKTTRLLQANIEYKKAKEEAASAIERANERHIELETVRREEGHLSKRVSEFTEKLVIQSQVSAQASEKTHKLHSKYETAQVELTRVETEIDALEQELEEHAKKDKNLRVKIETTHQSLQDNQALESSQLAAIAHLEGGGDPEAMSNVIDLQSYKDEPVLSSAKESEKPTEHVQTISLKDRVVTHMRSAFARDKDAEIKIETSEVGPVSLDEMPNPALLTGLDDTSNVFSRHQSSLLALGAVIGGVALLSGGVAINNLASSHSEIAVNIPQPTQVAHALSKIDPQISTVSSGYHVEAGASFISASLDEGDDIEFVSEVMPQTGIPTPKVKPIIKSSAYTYAAQMDGVEQGYETVTIDEPSDAPHAGVEAEAESSIFSPLTSTYAPLTGVDTIDIEAPEVVYADNDADIIASPSFQKEASLNANINYTYRAEVKRVNYPDLTMNIQTRLFNLGMYNGEIDGEQTEATRQSVKNFKTIFGMPADDKINAALLMKLKQAKRDQETAHVLAAENKLPSEVSAAPSVEVNDTVETVPTTPVLTENLPSEAPQSSTLVQDASYTPPTTAIN